MNDDRLPAGVTLEDVLAVLRPFAEYADFCTRKNMQAPPKNVAARHLLDRLAGGRLQGTDDVEPSAPAREPDPGGLSVRFSCRCLSHDASSRKAAGAPGK